MWNLAANRHRLSLTRMRSIPSSSTGSSCFRVGVSQLKDLLHASYLADMSDLAAKALRCYTRHGPPHPTKETPDRAFCGNTVVTKTRCSLAIRERG
jgi:hypothetical protein